MIRLIFLCFIFLSFAFPSISQNLALKKNYELSIKPNYPYSAPSTDTRSLTDGIYTALGAPSAQLRFWSQPTTVGWRLDNVSITLDLGKTYDIGSVEFSTVRAQEAGVYYPRNIFVFFSNDKINWHYIGDAADRADNLPGPSQREKFSINMINETARFVKLSVVRQGNFLFCDEIEVLKGKKSTAKRLPSVKRESLSAMIDSLQRPENNRRGILRLGKSLESFKERKYLISGFENHTAYFDFQSFKTELGNQNAAYLRKKINAPYVIEKFNPWSNLDEFRTPLKTSSLLDYNYVIPVGNVRYGSFVLTNLNSKKEKFFFDRFDDASYRMDLFVVPFVSASFYDQVADPMVKVLDSISIESGQSKMLVFKLTGLVEGKANGLLRVSSVRKVSEIRYSVEVVNSLIEKNLEPLNVNVWAYFKSILNKETEGVERDLKEHLVNTMVIPPTILPGLKTTDYTSFVDYVKKLKGFENILLYMDYSLPERKNSYANFMSNEWKVDFKTWYKRISETISAELGKEAKIYLYPFDEIMETDIEDSRNFMVWAKNTIGGVKFYATLGHKKAVDNLLPVVDIAQIHSSYEGLKKLPDHTAQVWIYSGGTPSRELSPYAFYRLMAWDAFVDDYNGIGFWNYADERNGNNLNLISDKYFNPAGSYSVIYNDTTGKIISSRRWEAFRLGIEDHSILQAYAKKFGFKKSKQFAAQVVNNPEDIGLADNVRDKMIKELLPE